MKLHASILVLSLCLGWSAGGALTSSLSRQKRQAKANIQGCTVSPAGIDNPNTPARENTQISITCNTDRSYDFCAFLHYKPMDVGQYGGQNQQDDKLTKCRVVHESGASGGTCDDDTRITRESSDTTCGIRIGQSHPDDTGKWTVSVSEIAATGAVNSPNTKIVTIYTFNRTVLIMTDERENYITRDVELWYNYDENEEDWREGAGDYQSIILQCKAMGGRPEPTFRWLINNDERNSFGDTMGNSDADNIFDTRDSWGGSYDTEGYIRDKISRLSFSVNREFMEYLHTKHGIEVNPSSGSFSFELGCVAEQGMNGDYALERQSLRVTIRRVYFEDALRGETIGMIVGIILAVIIILIVAGLLFFAYNTGRWCFGGGYEQPRDYPDDRNKRRHQAQR